VIVRYNEIMKTQAKVAKQNYNIKRILLIIVFIFSVQLIAMQLKEDVNWSLFDFLIMGVLLFGAGMTYEILSKKVRASNTRLVLGLVVLIAVMLIWAELGVGLFGTPFAGN
jgi:hypothetical protein